MYKNSQEHRRAVNEAVTENAWRTFWESQRGAEKQEYKTHKQNKEECFGCGKRVRQTHMEICQQVLHNYGHIESLCTSMYCDRCIPYFMAFDGTTHICLPCLLKDTKDNYEGIQIVADEWESDFNTCGLCLDLWIMIMKYGTSTTEGHQESTTHLLEGS